MRGSNLLCKIGWHAVAAPGLVISTGAHTDLPLAPLNDTSHWQRAGPALELWLASSSLRLHGHLLLHTGMQGMAGSGKAGSSVQCPKELAPLGLSGFKRTHLQRDITCLSAHDAGREMLGLTKGPASPCERSRDTLGKYWAVTGQTLRSWSASTVTGGIEASGVPQPCQGRSQRR